MLYKDELYGTFERKNKELGPFKVFAYLLFEKWFISSEGCVFKTDTEVQVKLNEELIKYNQNEIKSNRDALLETIKNWYNAKNPDFKTLRKRLVEK